MKKIFVFANDPACAAELTAGASGFGGSVTLITSGREYGSAHTVYSYPPELSAVSLLPAIGALVTGEGAELLLCESGRDGRLVAGYCAAKLGTSPLCDAMSLEYSGDKLRAARLVYGGSAVKTESCPLPAVAVLGAGLYEAGAAKSPELRALEISGWEGLELVGISAVESSAVNLAAAKKVVAAGRGLSSADNIPALEQLARLLGAEIGCTRPVAEEEHWYGKDRYIGVSGCMLKPNFYLAVGISGQIQHMVGVNQANVIFAIDKNENAPMISQADYSLIGDVNTVLPALIEKLS